MVGASTGAHLFPEGLNHFESSWYAVDKQARHFGQISTQVVIKTAEYCVLLLHESIEHGQWMPESLAEV